MRQEIFLCKEEEMFQLRLWKQRKDAKETLLQEGFRALGFLDLFSFCYFCFVYCFLSYFPSKALKRGKVFWCLTRGDAGAVKRDRLRTYWLSAFAGSSPASSTTPLLFVKRRCKGYPKKNRGRKAPVLEVIIYSYFSYFLCGIYG